MALDIEVKGDQSEEKGRINRYVLSGDLVAGRATLTVKADGSREREKSYYHLDHLNSTKVVTDEAGKVVVNYTYRAFGEQLKRLDEANRPTEDAAKYSYSGKELDEDIGLYYFNARYYDASIGRFINVDPIQDGSNWYVYCSNNPLSFVDPTGLVDWDTIFSGSIKMISGVSKITTGIAIIGTSGGGEVVTGGAATAVAVVGVLFGAGLVMDGVATASIGFAEAISGLTSNINPVDLPESLPHMVGIAGDVAIETVTGNDSNILEDTGKLVGNQPASSVNFLLTGTPAGNGAIQSSHELESHSSDVKIIELDLDAIRPETSEKEIEK